jgi:phospholipase/lecithinase/hemolysin
VILALAARLAVTLSTMLLASVCAGTETHWDRLYVFGDSYSDSGAGYLDGNGPTAVVYLAQALNIPFAVASGAHAPDQGLNFAVSGAPTDASVGYRVRSAVAACGTSEALLGRGMQIQVQDFILQVKHDEILFDAKTSIFFLAGGLNDRALGSATTLENLTREIRDLYRAGARHFWVALLPERIPELLGIAPAINAGIRGLPARLEPELAGATLRVSHWGEYFDEILNQAGSYGFRNSTDRCAGRAIFGEDPTPCSTPDQYYYFHTAHPSTAVHRIVARKMQHEFEKTAP